MTDPFSTFLYKDVKLSINITNRMKIEKVDKSGSYKVLSVLLMPINFQLPQFIEVGYPLTQPHTIIWLVNRFWVKNLLMDKIE